MGVQIQWSLIKMEKVKEFFQKVTEHFDEIPVMKTLSDMTSVPSGYLVGIIVAFCLFLVSTGLCQYIIMDLIGIMYPAYMSFKALETDYSDDDT